MENICPQCNKYDYRQVIIDGETPDMNIEPWCNCPEEEEDPANEVARDNVNV